jgi:hypothetical protein
VKWTKEEDRRLREAVEGMGAQKWTAIAAVVGDRTGKQCRERWTAHLNPELSVDPWTAEEDRLICELHNELGNQWSRIGRELNGRSANAVKNRFNYIKRRNLRVAKEARKKAASPVSCPMPIITIPESETQAVPMFDCGEYLEKFLELFPECDLFSGDFFQ